jgi:hypothetical protein
MVSLLNGLSALGASTAQFAGTAGLEAQKAQLQQQSLQLADQLQGARETAGRAQAGDILATAAAKEQTFQGGQNDLLRATQLAVANTQAGATLGSAGIAASAARADTAAEQAGATTRTAMTEAGLSSRTQMQVNAMTPEEREVRAYTGGAQPGTPEYQKGVRDLSLLKQGISPDLYGSTPSSGDGGTPAPAAGGTSTGTVTGAPTGAPTGASSGASTTSSGSPVPPVVAAAASSADPNAASQPPPTAKPGVGLSYKPLEPGLDNGAPPGGYNESILQGKPGWLVAKVHAINEGREEPPTPRSLGDPKSPEFIANALLNQYNPNFDATLYPARLKTREDVATGPIGTGITAANTAVQHAAEFLNAASNLNNGNFPVFNWIQNQYLDKTGSSRPLVVQEAVSALAAEARKVYVAGGSGGTQADLDAWEKNFPVNGSQEQQQAAMQTFGVLLHGRLTATANQINGGMQTKLSGTDLLNPTAKASFQTLFAPSPAASTADQPAAQMYGGQGLSKARPGALARPAAAAPVAAPAGAGAVPPSIQSLWGQ